MAGERTFPVLPETDPKLGGITWRRWEQRPVSLCASMPNACFTCGEVGPQSHAFGETWYDDPGHRRITSPSKVAEGRRPSSVRVEGGRRQLLTHYAVWCPACDEMRVHLTRTGNPMREFTELTQFYRPPATVKRAPRRTKAAPPPQEDALF